MKPLVACSITLNHEIAEKAKKLASKNRWSLTAWIREAVEEKLARELNESK